MDEWVFFIYGVNALHDPAKVYIAGKCDVPSEWNSFYKDIARDWQLAVNMEGTSSERYNMRWSAPTFNDLLADPMLEWLFHDPARADKILRRIPGEWVTVTYKEVLSAEERY
jgi:hypothetical protein